MVGLVDFAVAFVVLLAMILWFGIVPSWHIVWLPLLLLLATVTALGVGLALAALQVVFRDVRYANPYLLQLWMFATPIVYPSSLLPEPWKTLYGINPMSGVIEGFRWALVRTDTPPGPMLAVSTVVSLLLLFGGAYYFKSTEKTFADLV
jgi:lipopolysaccharide transport system permease protein